MNDETKEPEKESESEYEYSGDEYGNIYGEEATTKGGLISFFNRHRILVVFLIVIVFFGVYKLFGLFTSNGQEKTPAQQAVTTIKQKTQEAKVREPKISAPPRAKIQQAITTDTFKQPSLDTTIGDGSSQRVVAQLQRKLSNAIEKIDQLSPVINNLNNRIANLAAAVANINSTVTSINAQLKAKARPALHAAKRNGQNHINHIVHPRHLPRYFIQALIPGRAWVRSPSGETLTVSVGDHIPGYGVVRAIDVNRGIVKTSTGKVLEYAIEEN